MEKEFELSREKAEKMRENLGAEGMILVVYGPNGEASACALGVSAHQIFEAGENLLRKSSEISFSPEMAELCHEPDCPIHGNKKGILSPFQPGKEL